MQYQDEVVDYWNLKDLLWGGALDTLKDLEKANKQGELIDILEQVFCDRDEIPTITEINDFVWFERDTIYDYLGLDENGELIEEEEEEE